MKKNALRPLGITLLYIFINIMCVKAQISNKIYYNQDYEKCIKEAASYFVQYENDLNKINSWKVQIHLITGALYAEWNTNNLNNTNIIESRCEGEMKMYYPKGGLKSSTNYINNVLNGAEIFYFQNGNVKSTKFYKNGLQNGLFNQYDDKGKLLSSEIFQNGTGKYVDYNEENYSIKYEANFIDGLKEGAYSIYDNQGALTTRGLYKNDLLDGPQIYYFEVGEKIKKVNFYENDTLKSIHFDCNDYSSCKVIIENKFFNPLKTQASWSLSDYDNSSLEKEGLLIKSQSKKSKDGNTDIDLNIPWINYNNFTIEAEFVIKDNNTEYGLYWNENQSENSYDGFVVNTKDQSFEIETFDGTIFLKNKIGNSLKISTAINNKNTLSISKKGDDIYYSVNGVVIEKETYKDFKFNGKRFSIYVAPKNRNVNSKILVSKYTFKDDIEYETVKYYQEKVSKNNLYSYSGNGSGFFISGQGYIVTNNHVIEDSKEVLIESSISGAVEEYSAEVVKVDSKIDLAILKITDPKFKPFSEVHFNFNIDPSPIGTTAYAFGYPYGSVLGSEIKFTNGAISSNTGIFDDISRCQISAPIQPGNSGGPVFDDKCNLIGISVESLNKSLFTESENVNFAIKSIYLKALIDVLPQTISLPDYKKDMNKSTIEKVSEIKKYVVKVVTKQ